MLVKNHLYRFFFNFRILGIHFEIWEENFSILFPSDHTLDTRGRIKGRYLSIEGDKKKKGKLRYR